MTVVQDNSVGNRAQTVTQKDVSNVAGGSKTHNSNIEMADPTSTSSNSSINTGLKQEGGNSQHYSSGT